MVQRDESDGLYRRYAQAVAEAEIWNEQWEAEHIENAKLRELVGQYYSAMRCMLETGTWPTDPAYLEERMRELGVEVD